MSILISFFSGFQMNSVWKCADDVKGFTRKVKNRGWAVKVFPAYDIPEPVLCKGLSQAAFTGVSAFVYDKKYTNVAKVYSLHNGSFFAEYDTAEFGEIGILYNSLEDCMRGIQEQFEIALNTSVDGNKILV